MSELLKSQSADIIKSHVKGVDTVALCNAFGLHPSVFGYTIFGYEGSTEKTSLFGDNPSSKPSRMKFTYTVSKQYNDLKALFSSEDYKEVFMNTIKNIKANFNNPDYAFACNQLAGDVKAYRTKSGDFILVPGETVTVINILSLETVQLLKNLPVELDFEDIELKTSEFVYDLLKARYKCDLTIHLDNIMYGTDYINKLHNEILQLLPESRDVICRAEKANHIFVYTAKSLDNYQVTADATGGMRKKHWGKEI